MTNPGKIFGLILLIFLLLPSGGVISATTEKPVLQIEKQGAFAAGGTVIPAREKYNPRHPTPESQTLHGDHANVVY